MFKLNQTTTRWMGGAALTLALVLGGSLLAANTASAQTPGPSTTAPAATTPVPATPPGTGKMDTAQVQTWITAADGFLAQAKTAQTAQQYGQAAAMPRRGKPWRARQRPPRN